MALFKIGDRVKKVRGSNNIGVTGVVTAFSQRWMFVKSDCAWRLPTGDLMAPGAEGSTDPQWWELIQDKPLGEKIMEMKGLPEFNPQPKVTVNA